jgi:hypothetical protein
MIRWLSQLWVSSAADRGGPPSKIWRWTFGRFASQRAFALQMRQLDGQLKRQAASQQRALAREHLPVGRYAPRSGRGHDGPGVKRSGLFSGDGPGWLRPALTAGTLAAVLATAWFAWPTAATRSPQELREITAQSFDRLWGPLARQAETTGQALRSQVVQVTALPQRLSAIDGVVSGLGESIQSPIREEVRRFADDMTRPWTYLADQLPWLPRDRTPATEEASAPS